MEILDSYGKGEIAALLKEVGQDYSAYQKKKKELSESRMDEEQRRREMDFLSFEIGEIREAELKAGEDDELESQYRLLLNSQKIQEGLNAAYQAAGYDRKRSGGNRSGVPCGS